MDKAKPDPRNDYTCIKLEFKWSNPWMRKLSKEDGWL